MKGKVKDFTLVTMGALIAAIGYNTILVENNIASGGVGGLAISLRALFGWSPSFFVLLSTVPLLLLCLIFLGKSVFIKTLYGSWIYPIFINLTDTLPSLTHDKLLAAIFGGIILGFGLGLVFMGNSSTGGTGIVVQILHKYLPIPFGIIVGTVDGIIVAISFVAFEPDTVMYSIISLMIVTYVINLMMSGTDSLRNLMIISKKSSEIKQYITKIADRGVTELPIIGGYTNQEKRMLMTTISRPEFQAIERAVLDIDETAFIIVMPATRVKGRGFSLHKYHQLEDDFLPPM